MDQAPNASAPAAPAPTSPDFDKLGTFYIGRAYDLAARRRTDELVLYDSRDLVTHAVCVGMTGSGKTGLCIDLLEEAAIDSIPAIVIDPKGDLANLLLTFPELRPADFAPWINEGDAKAAGVSPAQFAEQQAAMWAKGLADWGQDGARIRRLRDAADFAVYTPGSTAGLPVSVLKSFAVPERAILDDGELLRERIGTTVGSLLGLLSIDADPIRSREHILLSTILNQAWSTGQELDLGSLIRQIQSPPVQRIGVLELESFFPSADRFALAMQLNNLLASPGFSAWMEGEPLDIGAMLHTPDGRARVSIFSIAHLSDAERMFFVSLLLGQVLGWVRTQSGTSSLRAILYMDEIAGYFPPVANPPSKPPLLTLMKQGRAFGFGVVLATQNPVDLDYKGLANAGTWFIGRLQTERDKARVLDGLEGASAAASSAFDRAAADKALSGLSTRVFLMNNVHDNAPVIIESRWALSYLRGPLTRAQIKTLMDPRRAGARSTSAGESTSAAPPAGAPPATATAAPSTSAASLSQRPVLPPDVPQYFIPVRAARPAAASLRYRPMLLGCARLHYADPKTGVDQDQAVSFLAPIQIGPVAIDWDAAAPVTITDADLDPDPSGAPSGSAGGGPAGGVGGVGGGGFESLPPDASKPRSYDGWKKSFADMLYRTQRIEILSCEDPALLSRAGETERDFRARLQQLAREKRDAFADKLRQKYAARTAALQERLRRAQQAVEEQAAQARSAKLQTAVSFGSAVVSAFFGRRSSVGGVGRATTAARGVSRSMKESSDVGRARESLESLQRQMDELTAEIQAEVEAANARFDPSGARLDRVAIKPKRTSISIRAVVLAWAPHWTDGSGPATPAW